MTTTLVVHGDARRLPVEDGSVRLIVSSPPYNAGIAYGGDVSDSLPWDEYEALVRDSVASWVPKLADHGRVFINVQSAVPYSSEPSSRRRYNLGLLWDGVLAEHFEYRDTISWVQDSWDGACAWGSWCRPSAPNLRGSHEVIFVYSKGDWARPTPPDMKGWKDEREGFGGNWEDLCRNVWKLKPVPRSAGPAPYPMELPGRAIRLSTYPGELVVDPFCGRGATVRAAKLLGRSSVGVDLSTREVVEANRILAEEAEAA